MRAIDTNIVVRLLINDDPRQAARARETIENEPVRVATTVILESAWVLRRSYGMAQGAIVEALRLFTGHKNILLSDPEIVKRALELADKGLSIADAVHLASTPDCSSFVTFDRAMQKVAANIGGIRVEAP